MRKLLHKLWIYIRPFCKWQFLVSYFIPFMLVNGWAWIGTILMPLIGANWFTIAATTWLGILWLPCTPEKIITVPIAIWIHTKLFGKHGKTHWQLMRMYAEARKDWLTVRSKLTFHKTCDSCAHNRYCERDRSIKRCKYFRIRTHKHDC